MIAYPKKKLFKNILIKKIFEYVFNKVCRTV